MLETIRFRGEVREHGVRLPKSAGLGKEAVVEGIVEAFPFRAPVEPDGKAGRRLPIDEALRGDAETLTIELTRLGNEPEIRVPADFRAALTANPRAQAQWEKTTPNARRDWVLWILTGKQAATRTIRIEKACDMLASGKKRVCCFGGLGWLSKQHPEVETWAPLPK